MALDVEVAGASISTEERHGLSTTAIPADALQALVIGPDAGADSKELGLGVAAKLGLFARP